MLIVSKFHDYYDSITAWGIDKTVVYQRQEKAIPLSKEEKGLFAGRYEYGRRMRYLGKGAEMRVVGFCGKLHPFLEVRINQYSKGPRTFYCYDAKGAISVLKENKFDLERHSKPWGTVFRLGAENLVKDAFLLERYKPLEKYFQLYKAPVFIAGNELDIPALKKINNKSDLLILNPRLTDWYFQPIKDPVTAFQEIYMFLSGVLGTPERPTVEIDDKHKAMAHGHDGKYSFRKTPGNGQWR